MKERHHGWLLWRYALVAALTVTSVASGCHCSKPISQMTPGDAAQEFPDTGMPDAGPGGRELADGNFWNVYSGIGYADAGGTVLHAVVGEGVTVSTTTGVALGDLDVVQVSPAFTTAVTSDQQAYVDDVVVSPGPPERLLFLDRFTANPTGAGVGTLMMTDLSRWHPPAVTPQTNQLGNNETVTGLGVTPSSFYFGQNGNEILFIDDYSQGTGTLVWTDGNGTFQVIGTGATTAALVLSADRSHAYAAIHVGATSATAGGNVDPDLGDLVAIDLATGTSVPVASAVTALPHEHFCPAALCAGAGADCGSGCSCVSNLPDGGMDTGPQWYCSCAAPPSCTYLNQSLEPMFSVSADGSSVAYESPVAEMANYAISVATITGGSPRVTVVGEGEFPGISADGQKVAYFDPFHAGGATVEVRDAMANPVVSAPAVMGEAAPRFSPDGAFVAFPQNFGIRGVQLAGEIADVWLIQAMTGGLAVRYATKAAWKSVTFWPASGTTSQVSVLAALSDPSGEATLTNGTGNLLVDNPNSLFASGAMPSNAIAANLHPEDIGLLPVSGGFALSENGSLGAWLPASSGAIRRPGAFNSLQASIAEGTLHTSQSVDGLMQDEVVFLSSRLSPLGLQAPGPLWGGSSTMVAALPQGAKNNVVRFALTPDGRVLAIVQDTASLAEVWLLPLATAGN